MLSVDVLTVPYPHYQHNQPLVSNSADDAIVSDSVSPQFAKQRSLERFTSASWILELSYPFVQKLFDTTSGLLVEFVYFATGVSRELNPPRHVAS
jgi:hypothetical protein